jgi:hypothetical protein
MPEERKNSHTDGYVYELQELFLGQKKIPLFGKFDFEGEVP